MRVLIWSIVIISFFMFVIHDSGTWEIRRVEEIRSSIDYKVAKYELHWDRFFNYIKNIPRYIYRNLSRYLR